MEGGPLKPAFGFGGISSPNSVIPTGTDHREAMICVVDVWVPHSKFRVFCEI